MPSLGPAEILVILVVALLVFGPNKMPEIARQVGKGMRELKRVQEHLSTELRDVVSEFDGSGDTAMPSTAETIGDAVPTLPPKAEPTTPEPPAVEAPPDEPAQAEPPPVTPPAPPAAPPSDTSGGSPADRGSRVWPPPAGV
jgi:sec-independent protein translocase protein TatA